MKVICVPENATPIFKSFGGFDPAWCGTEKVVQVQKMLLRAQLHQEEIATLSSELFVGPSVIIYDRGTLDGKTFCTPEEWKKVTQDSGFSDEDLLGRYDLVVHLESVACFKEDATLYVYGEGSNNESRFHTPEEAAENDVLAGTIYKSHKKYRKFKNKKTFEEKIDDVKKYVLDELKHI